MTEKQMHIRKLGRDASYLAGCALHDIVPVCKEMDLEGLYRFCQFHSITAIVAMALEEVWKQEPAEESVMHKFRQARDKAIRKNILLNTERQRILAHLESIGCWYMPLKGSLLQFDYPKFGMRQMGDNDILIDSAFESRIYDFMIGSGYEAAVYQKGNHDEYIRQPVYNIEMHKSLFMSSSSPELSRYYQDIRSRMRKDGDNGFGYHLDPADFYIYLVAHAYKHYVYSGIGIRNMLDVYVYQNRHADEMDWDYICRELNQFGAADFEAECRVLGSKLFAKPAREPDLTQEQWQILDIYFSSGTFGTQGSQVSKAVSSAGDSSSSGGKLRYLLSRLFPSVQYMIEMEPRLAGKRWLIPFAYLRRLFRGLFCRTGDVAREVSMVSRTKKDK